MKLSLFFKVLVILGIAIIGLFFAYNNGYFNQNSPQNIINQEKSQTEVRPLENLPRGDIKIKKQIKVDLSKQKVYLFENGQIVKEFAISSGKIETPTPTGKFRVIYK